MFDTVCRKRYSTTKPSVRSQVAWINWPYIQVSTDVILYMLTQIQPNMWKHYAFQSVNNDQLPKTLLYRCLSRELCLQTWQHVVMYIRVNMSIKNIGLPSHISQSDGRSFSIMGRISLTCRLHFNLSYSYKPLQE